MTDLLNLAAKELGSRGGKATSKKYGKEHYQDLADNMNLKLGRKVKKRPVDKLPVA